MNVQVVNNSLQPELERSAVENRFAQTILDSWNCRESPMIFGIYRHLKERFLAERAFGKVHPSLCETGYGVLQEVDWLRLCRQTTVFAFRLITPFRRL